MQPLPHNPALLKPPSSFTLKPNQPLLTVEPSVISVEPIFTELVPLRPNSQYILYWYVAETVPPEVEESLNAMVEDRSSADEGLPFFPPPPFDEGMTLEERIKLDVLEDGSMYEPIRHPNTGVDDEEALYESYLLPIEEGAQKVRGTILEHVIRRGWQAICDRHEHEIKVGKQEM